MVILVRISTNGIYRTFSPIPSFFVCRQSIALKVNNLFSWDVLKVWSPYPGEGTASWFMNSPHPLNSITENITLAGAT